MRLSCLVDEGPIPVASHQHAFGDGLACDTRLHLRCDTRQVHRDPSVLHGGAREGGRRIPDGRMTKLCTSPDADLDDGRLVHAGQDQRLTHRRPEPGSLEGGAVQVGALTRHGAVRRDRDADDGRLRRDGCGDVDAHGHRGGS